jgi:hypothetical protein
VADCDKTSDRASNQEIRSIDIHAFGVNANWILAPSSIRPWTYEMKGESDSAIKGGTISRH